MVKEVVSLRVEVNTVNEMLSKHSGELDEAQNTRNCTRGYRLNENYHKEMRYVINWRKGLSLHETSETLMLHRICC